MSKLTSQDKRTVAKYISPYIHEVGESSMSLMVYQRLNMWLEGFSFAEIAAEEGVSTQTVNTSVKRVVEDVLAFAQEYQDAAS